ncbi:MAG: hypothetical protein U0237_11625 [Thermoleophilia bacterium]
MLRLGDVPDVTAPTEVFVVSARKAAARSHDRTLVARAVLEAVVAASLTRAEAAPPVRAQDALAALESAPPERDAVWTEHAEWAAKQIQEVLASAR